MKDFFKQYCREFLKEALTLCKIIQSNEGIEERFELSPVFKNGKFDHLESRKVPNYPDFLIRNSDSVCNPKSDSYKGFNLILSERKAIKDHLKGKIFDDHDRPIETQDVAAYTKNIVLDFVKAYLETYKSFEFDPATFDELFFRFLRYVDFEINTVYFFSPLHNLLTPAKFMRLDSNLEIKKVSPEEFKEIARIGFRGSNYTAVPAFLWPLTHVLTILITPVNFYDDNKKVLEIFENVVQALKVFDEGNVHLGGIYRKNSSIWKTRTILVGTEYAHQSKNKMRLSREKIDMFPTFYKYFKTLDFKANMKFIDIAIKRFSYASNRDNIDDRIVDYVICLEALLLDGSAETTTRFANRGAILLGNNDNDRESIWLFLRKAYNLRSGLVHGEGVRSFQINETQYTNEEVSEKLDEICRSAIKKILNLTISYNKKQILDELDVALLNRSRLKEILRRTIGKF